jgi:hypothetical protein
MAIERCCEGEQTMRDREESEEEESKEYSHPAYEQL